MIVIEGWWCTKCEFFESEDGIDTTVDKCQLCGCDGASHIPVEIVSK